MEARMLATDESAAVQNFVRIRKLFEDSEGIHSELRKEAVLFLDAIIKPKPGDSHDLRSGLLFLLHILEGSRWRLSEFPAVVDTYEFITDALSVTRGE